VERIPLRKVYMETFKVNYVMDFCGSKTRKSMTIKADSEEEAKKMVEQQTKEISRVNGFSENEFYVE
jgi:uncharacterized lipoprotein YehR (DUF1307 family)